MKGKESEYLQSPWRVLAYAIYPWRKRFAVMCVLMLLGNAFEYSLPYFLERIVNIATGSSTAPSFHTFLFPVVAIGVVLLSSEICFRIAHMGEIYVATGAFERITNDLYDRLIKRPTSYFENKFSGDLGRRIQQIGTATTFFIDSLPWQISWIVLSITAAGILLAITNIHLFYIFIIWLIFFIGTSIPLWKWSHRASEKVAKAHASMSGNIVDTLGNIPLVHSFGAVPYEQTLHKETLARVVDAEKTMRWISVLNKFQQGLSVVILGTSLVVTSVFLYSHDALTLGGFVIIAAIIPQLTGAIWNLGDMAMRAIREFGELSDAAQNLRSAEGELLGGAITSANEKLDLSFTGLGFQYPGTESAVFKDFSLHIMQGERVGIVGISGAGKSTLVKLLLRQYELQHGTISIGGIPIKQFTLESLRGLISYVPQDTSLFHRSLFDNIQYAKPTATKEEVLRASKQAHAHEFIETLPQGYETKVGERGVKLSGGQRQRIALARAILKNAPILVLDEATSALDSESETLIQDGLQELFEHRTVVAIAHRLSTLRSMDRILVMEDGSIIESGSPQELLAREDGTFKRMWEHQKNGFV